MRGDEPAFEGQDEGSGKRTFNSDNQDNVDDGFCAFFMVIANAQNLSMQLSRFQVYDAKTIMKQNNIVYCQCIRVGFKDLCRN